MKDPNDVLNEASDYVMDNLKEGLIEIIDMQDNGILRDGVVRHTHDILLQSISSSHCLTLAVNLFTGAGIRAFVNPGTK